ncbi:hypothetical protein DUI87_22363 [Hirundo rustica rustica]|uniref:Uncharacterized protein n=1 Tax=Hirundo rustica rustica TaxID=333673 RepID=A0A3M0K1U1_HIRRU|nr:hypothetical protein DUI87_22363 [Hirundo rustica rustica]
MRLSWSSANASARSCNWIEVIPNMRTDWGEEVIEPGGKGLGESLMDEKLDMRQWCALGAQRANCIPGCIKRSVVSSLREVIIPLYSAFVRPLLEYCIQLCNFQHKTDTDLLE